MRKRYSKYNAKKVVVGGEKFDSKKECRRWQELKLLEQSGAISGLQRQVEFELIPTQRRLKWDTKKRKSVYKVIERPVKYIADFAYMDAIEGLIVEDVKGLRTPVYILKRKLMLYLKNIEIKEI